MYLKIDAFEVPDNKNIGKLFSKCELLLLDKAHSTSDFVLTLQNQGY